MDKLTKETLYQEYIIDLSSQQQIAEKYGITRKAVRCKLKKWDIVKTKEDRYLTQGRVMREVYKNTDLAKQRSQFWSNPENLEKMRTNIKKTYSTGKPQDKIRKSLEHLNQNPEFLKKRGEKIKESYKKDPQINIRRSQTLCKMYQDRPELKNLISENSKAYWENLSEEDREDILEKRKLSFIINDSAYKAHLTKKANGTYSKSKEEDEVYNHLLAAFPDVVRFYHDPRYRSSSGHLWECDFYIPSEDLFIEYQGHWRHGREPFNSKNPKHLAILNKWKSKSLEINRQGKTKKQYISAIEKWTISDPEKRQVVKQNHLNFIEFFSIEECTTWLNERGI